MNADLNALRRLRRSRRLLAAALAASVATLPFPALFAANTPIQAPASNQLALTSAQLQTAAEQAFPREEEWLGGLATMTLSRPQVAIPVDGDRIQLDLDYDVAVAGSGQGERGRLRVASGLRYNPMTRGLHLDRPALLDLQSQGKGSALGGETREMVNALLQQYTQEEPIYRLDAETLAQIPGNLGADAIRIQGGQVHLRLDAGE